MFLLFLATLCFFQTKLCFFCLLCVDFLPPKTPQKSLRWKRELGETIDPSTLVVVASPFARTLETATLASSAVGIKGFQNVSDEHNDEDARFSADEALRERHFGGFELQSHDHYRTVWVEDARDVNWRAPPASARGGDGKEGGGGGDREGESVVDVAARLRALFARLEATYSNKNVLLVAHGDTLSIATAVARGGGLGRHREHAQDTGELRKL